MRHDTAGRSVVLRCEVPNHAADGRQQQDEAYDAPHDGATGWTVADELFMWPVLRIGDSLAGTIGARSPCRPPKKRGHFALLGYVGQRARRNGVRIAPVAVDVG